MNECLVLGITFWSESARIAEDWLGLREDLMTQVFPKMLRESDPFTEVGEGRCVPDPRGELVKGTRPSLSVSEHSVP